MAETQAKVFVVDDDPAVRQSMQWLIESIGLSVETYADAKSFLENYNPEVPGCLLLDVRMPGMSGLELHEKLLEKNIAAPVIIITGHADVTMAVRSMKSGAVDFIEKPYSDQNVLDSINQAIKRDQTTRSGQQIRKKMSARLARLTAREREVMELVVDGMPNKAIANELGVSPKTVEVHRANVMAKVKAGSLPELVRIAMLVEPHKLESVVS